ncbi:neuronal PAS domain-containing protein 4B-like isoform X2 [Pectinophora gossypiella]|uniref:neuronal PAS domain-containing protein 4B-like isoform X2 n=1 Tax=Pectinophora gossypiella TaxID=13191 RepID=UPI00214E2485|nr:neuronal PAS domain-containing protein 4B-like isoform X2 [Pectinophora gossypiella]
MFTRFDQGKSTKGASKLRRDLINAEIANLRDLLPLPPSTRQRLSQLQLMALVCVYVRKSNYFQQVFKRFDINQQSSSAPNFGFSKALNGFLMMMTQNGKLLYISDNAAEYLGHSMEDLLIHGDSVYDVIDKQDQQAVRTELSRAPTDGEDRVFLCRMNVARNARRQMRFGDQKVVLVRGHYVSYLPLCSRNEPVFLCVCTPLAMPETRECVVHGATNVFTTVHAMDMKILHIDANEWHLGWERTSLHGVSWYHLLHPDCCKEAQTKHRLITQSEQERSCIALLRLQRRSGQFLWVHAVLQLKDNLENSQRPVIVCTNQVLSEQEAAVMKANPWLYHYYAVQSKLHYGLAYEAATRMYGPPPPDIQVYPPAMQYAPAPPVCVNGNQVAMMPNPGIQAHIPHVPPHLTPMHYAYERTDNGPVDYSVSLHENRYHNIRIEDTRIQPNAKRKGKNSDEKPNTPVANLSPRGTPSTVTSGGDTLVAVAGSIASRRPGSKNFNISETEMVDQWNPSPTWSESALQKVPDVCHQDLSPYVTTTPPTPSGTPSAYTHNYSHTFVFDWSPEQYVPHTNNRCNTVTTESSYQQTWNRSQRTSFANSAESSVPAAELSTNCNPNRLSLQMRVSNPPPAYNATREGEILRRQIDRPHPDSPDAKKPAL